MLQMCKVRPVRAILFDMDGVLLDSEMEFRQILLHLLEEQNVHLSAASQQEMIGASAIQTQDIVWRDTGVLLDWDHLIEEIDAVLSHDAERNQRLLFPDVQPFLEEAQRRGIVMGLATSSERPWAEAFLENCSLGSFFSQIVTGSEVQTHKPDPGIYLESLRILGLPAEDCIAIEDSTRGIEAAQAAGLRVLARRHPVLPIDQSAAWARFHSLNELWRMPGLLWPQRFVQQAHQENGEV